eukprot:COSAG01_NODE_519_length_16012_cov_4.344058_6_plen_245_part_00
MSYSVAKSGQSMCDKWLKDNHLLNGLLFYGSMSAYPNHAALYFIEGYFRKHSQKHKENYKDNNPDFIQYADPIKIEDIRTIQDRVRFGPTQYPALFVLLEKIEDMTQGAANAFLKLLESPPANVYFILSSTHLTRILPTILSRSQRFYCAPIPEAKDSTLNTFQTYKDFKQFRLVKRLAFLYETITHRDHLKLLIYDWLDEINQDQDINRSQKNQDISTLFSFLKRLDRHINLKLQMDALSCSL